jgi:VWFA-related protein
VSLSALWLNLLLSGAQIQTTQPPSPPVFAVEVENVMIDAFVTQRGTPVTGLGAEHFELRDNGVPQRLELVASDAQPVLAVLAFDASGSLGGEKLETLRAASQVLLDALRSEDEATLFTFSDIIEWSSPPSTDRQQVRRALGRVKPGGGTAIMDALYAALLLPSSAGRSLVVLFTDGADNLSWIDGRQLRLVAERSNAIIHIVSLDSLPRPSAGPPPSQVNGRRPLANAYGYESALLLRRIAETTGGRYWETASLDRLKPAFAAIAEAMGKRYVLRYTPENVTRSGWHKIELKLRGKKGEIHARSGYWVKGP